MHLKQKNCWIKKTYIVTNYINEFNICQKTKYSRMIPNSSLISKETPSKLFEITHIDTFQYKSQIYLRQSNTKTKRS